MPSSDFPFASVSETAEMLGITDGRVRQLLLSGDLHGHKLGEKSWAIPVYEIRRYQSLPSPRVGRPRIGKDETTTPPSIEMAIEEKNIPGATSGVD